MMGVVYNVMLLHINNKLGHLSDVTIVTALHSA